MNTAAARQHTLPSDVPGLQGVSVVDASDEQLVECRDKDRAWVEKFLADTSRDPGSERNQRVIQRVQDRVAAIDAELARRRDEADARTERTRADARAWLRGFLQGAPKTQAQLHERAAEVAEAWRLVEPIARAVGLLAASYRSRDASLPALHQQFTASVRRAAQALGVAEPELLEEPVLPSHDEVMQAVRVIRGEADWPDDSPPQVGLSSVERVVRQAG